MFDASRLTHRLIVTCCVAALSATNFAGVSQAQTPTTEVSVGALRSELRVDYSATDHAHWARLGVIYNRYKGDPTGEQEAYAQEYSIFLEEQALAFSERTVAAGEAATVAQPPLSPYDAYYAANTSNPNVLTRKQFEEYYTANAADPNALTPKQLESYYADKARHDGIVHSRLAAGMPAEPDYSKLGAVARTCIDNAYNPAERCPPKRNWREEIGLDKKPTEQVDGLKVGAAIAVGVVALALAAKAREAEEYRKMSPEQKAEYDRQRSAESITVPTYEQPNPWDTITEQKQYVCVYGAGAESARACNDVGW